MPESETQVSHKKKEYYVHIYIRMSLSFSRFIRIQKKYLYEHFPFELSYYIVGWINIHAMYIKVKCIIKKNSLFFRCLHLDFAVILFPFLRLFIQCCHHFMLVVVLKRRREKKKSIECKNYGTAEWERTKKKNLSNIKMRFLLPTASQASERTI